MRTEDILAFENERRFLREALVRYRAEVVLDAAQACPSVVGPEDAVSVGEAAGDSSSPRDGPQGGCKAARPERTERTEKEVQVVRLV